MQMYQPRFYIAALSGILAFSPIPVATVSRLARTRPKGSRTSRTLRFRRTGLSGQTTGSERWLPIARVTLPLRSIRQTNGIRRDCSHPRTSMHAFVRPTADYRGITTYMSLALEEEET